MANLIRIELKLSIIVYKGNVYDTKKDRDRDHPVTVHYIQVYRLIRKTNHFLRIAYLLKGRQTIR